MTSKQHVYAHCLTLFFIAMIRAQELEKLGLHSLFSHILNTNYPLDLKKKKIIIHPEL